MNGLECSVMLIGVFLLIVLALRGAQRWLGTDRRNQTRRRADRR
ncbi:hypothetical protein [Amycolatopsis sp. FDAARGOS 1241]|nr:hypothetical protein [Amycolatopsis sp. FDAARGOS 1241]